MKVCPNCGAENEDVALTCILCDFEFDIDTDVIAESNVSNETIDDMESSNESGEHKNSPDSAENVEYTVSQNRKSSGKLIAIIAIVIVVGVLASVLFMMSRDKKSDTSDDNSAVSDVVETTAESTDAPTESEITTTTIKTTISTVAASEINTKEATLPKEEITESTTEKTDTTDAVKQALSEHMNAESGSLYFDPEPTYSLYDVNGDGVDELFISYNNVESLGSDLYVYKNDKYVKLQNFYNGAIVCLSEHILIEKRYGGGEMTKIYCIVDNDLLQKDEISMSFSNNYEYYHDDYCITESEYNQLMAKYDTMDQIYVPNNSRPVSELIDISKYTVNINSGTNNSNNSSIYEGYNYIENAPSDMTFYETGENPTGIVNTESTSLNMRQGPGANYEVILYLQKGEIVEVLGMNSEWAYIKWSVWGAQQMIDYYGYVSRDFLSVGYG